MAGNRSSAATWNARGCAFALVASAGAASPVFAQSGTVGSGCGYEIIETLPNGPQCGSDPYSPNILDIADDGTVCGFARAFLCPDRAFVQSPGGPLVFLPVPPGSLGSWANAIGPTGTIVGNFRGRDDQLKPCKWVSGTCVPLPMLRNANFGDALGLNSTNLIVGYCTNTTTGPGHACAWVGDQIVDIHPGQPWMDSRAADVNDKGQIAGTVYSGATMERAFRRTLAGDVQVLDAILGGTSSNARAIDALGNIIGIGLYLPVGQSTPVARSFYWRNEVMIDLGVLPGVSSMRAQDVSDGGRIVGRATPGGRAFIWDRGVLQTVNVNGLAQSALLPAINNAGVIGDNDRRIAPLSVNVADIDVNCAVNTDDLLQVLANWGDTVSPADVNQDGIVDGADLHLVLLNWG